MPPSSASAPRSVALRDLLRAAVATSAAWPLWTVDHPPIQDLPQHLAAIRVLHDFQDPAWAFSEVFVLDLGRTQYLAVYLVAHLLAYPLGVELATRVLLTAAVIGVPFAVRSVGRGLGGSGDLAFLLAIPLVWNAHLILGFLNFVVALPLSLAVVAGAIGGRQREAQPTGDHPPCAWGSRRRSASIGAGLVLVFVTHVVPFAFAALGVGLLALGGGLGRSLRRGLVLLPAVSVAGLWVALSPAGQATAAAATTGSGARFTPIASALTEIPAWLLDVLHGPGDDRVFVAWLVLLLAVIALAGGEANECLGRRRLALLPPLAFALYVVTPASYDWIWPISARFPLLALLWLLPLLRSPALPGLARTLPVAAAAAIALASTTTITQAFQRFEAEEVGPLDDAVASVPRGSRTAGLIFDRGSRVVKFSPFIHAVAWVQARRGGAVMFTFADFPPSPFRFREDDRPPRVPPRWEWKPEQVDVRRDLDWYDHVFVRGPARSLERARDLWEPVFRGGPWSVWRRRGR